jgi:hypothetical protein
MLRSALIKAMSLNLKFCKETNMNYDLLTPKTTNKLDPLMWANMVLDLEKIGLNGKVLLTASDEYLIELHQVYFPVPFNVE